MLRSDPAKSGASWPISICSIDRLPVPVHELDGIFDGHHMVAPIGVDQVDQRSQGRALAASGGSGDQDESLAGLRELPEGRRQVQRFERGNFFGKQTDAARDGAALVMDVGAESPDAFAAEAQVDRLGALQFVALRL